MSETFRIAIVHYHLRTGGVTRVIQHASSALSGQVKMVVIVGEPPQVEAPLPHVAVINGLGYEGARQKRRAQQLVQQMRMAARRVLGAPPHIWHFHNHALGKSRVLPEVVYHLAQTGERLLLQLHDFAEDGRPANYRFLLDHLGGDTGKLGALLYPQASHVHYAVLNRRDQCFLQRAGVPETHLHLLPNAVWIEAPSPAETGWREGSAERLFLYPVRAIRRKNIGEFLLWSALGKRGDRFAISLAPQNPLARPIYAQWVAFARSLDLPVAFDLVTTSQQPLAALVHAAHALITTSVAEGFGLAFLEPWLLNRALLGRKLPEITAEFEEAGVDLSDLYNRLTVPVEWIGGPVVLRRKLAAALPSYLASYGRHMQPGDVEQILHTLLNNGRVDFGRLDEELQAQIIRHLVHTPAARQELSPPSLPSAEDSKKIERNRQAVQQAFSLERYGQRLMQIYRQVMESPVDSLDSLSADLLLDQFLAPERFSLLRT